MNKEKRRKINRLYRLNNKDKIKEINRLYRLNNKDKLKEKNRLYYLNNKKKRKEINRLFNLNNQEYIKKYRLNNKDKFKKYQKEYRLNNKDKIKEYRLKNKDTIKEYRLKNKEKTSREYKLYSIKNRNLLNANEAKRRALKLKATPKFANLNKIKEIYKNCPKGYHVDHIVPLQGKEVCGLHVEWNLQYLTPSENSSKSNKLINNYL